MKNLQPSYLMGDWRKQPTIIKKFRDRKMCILILTRNQFFLFVLDAAGRRYGKCKGEGDSGTRLLVAWYTHTQGWIAIQNKRKD